MLSNPAVAQSFNEALNNPAFVDFMIQQNPMLRDLPNAREILQSPGFRAMMTNPETIRSAARLRRAMGGLGGASAFPAPGATDTTPAGAPASGPAGAGGGAAPQSPSAAANPFAALQFGQPGAGSPPSAGGAASPFGDLASVTQLLQAM